MVNTFEYILKIDRHSKQLIMKLIYLTDIHGSFSRVYNLLNETIADAYIISGDLIDMPFYSIDSYKANPFLNTIGSSFIE